MGNRIMRTVLFAASALLSMSALGAGAVRFGTLRNSDWVVTNAWQAVRNKTYDLILEIGQGDSLPPDWQNVSNAAMNAVQSLQPATNYTDEVALDFEEGRRTSYNADNSTFSQISTMLGDTDVAYTAQDLINESTNAAVAVADTKISTNNEAFVSAVLAAPLVGADPSDLSELSEYGTYGTVGAALLALIAGLAALKRRMSSAETTISGKLDGTAAYPSWEEGVEYWDESPPVSFGGRLWRAISTTTDSPADDPTSWEEVTIDDMKQDALSSAQESAVNSGATAAKVATWDGYAAQIAQKASFADLPYAMVTPDEWEWIKTSSGGLDLATITYDDGQGVWHIELEGSEVDIPVFGDGTEKVLEFTYDGVSYVLVDSLHLLARANNLVIVAANTTLTLPPFEAGKVRDLLVACTIGLDGNDEPWSVIFQGGDGEEISFKAEGDDAASATFPVPDAAGDWWYSLTERAPHVFAVSLKQLQSVSQPTQTQGGS